MSFSAGSKLLASASYDHKVRVYEIAPGKVPELRAVDGRPVRVLSWRGRRGAHGVPDGAAEWNGVR